MTERELLQQLEEVKLQISNKDFWNEDTTELRKKQIEICQALVDLHPRRNEPYLREAWFSYYQYMDEKNQKQLDKHKTYAKLILSLVGFCLANVELSLLCISFLS